MTEMERVFHTDIVTLNNYLKAYTEYMPNDEKYHINIANSIWFKDMEGLTVNNDFLKINKTFYDAAVFKAPFDNGTKNDINAWVNKETNGIIDKLLEKEPPQDAIMYLINALSFDAEWERLLTAEKPIFLL